MKSEYFLTALFIIVSASNMLYMKRSMEDLEGTLSLVTGKGVLLEGPACVLKGDTLQDEAAAVAIARACVRAQKDKHEQNHNPPVDQDL
jgi:hypothetical protein